MTSCVHCSRTLPVAEEMCLWCGRWQNGRTPMCEEHESSASTGVCSVCGRPVCAACSSTVDGRLVCRVTSHRSLATDHRLLLTLESEFEADWIVTILRQAGVAAIQYSLRDHASARWFPVVHPVRVHVPAAAIAQARVVLARFDDLTLLPDRP